MRKQVNRLNFSRLIHIHFSTELLVHSVKSLGPGPETGPEKTLLGLGLDRDRNQQKKITRTESGTGTKKKLGPTHPYWRVDLCFYLGLHRFVSGFFLVTFHVLLE